MTLICVCYEIDENVESVFIELNERENIDVVDLTTINIVQDIFDKDVKVSKDVINSYFVIIHEIDAFKILFDDDEIDVSWFRIIEKFSVINDDLFIEKVKIDATINLNLFAWRSRICWCDLKLLSNLI